MIKTLNFNSAIGDKLKKVCSFSGDGGEQEAWERLGKTSFPYLSVGLLIWVCLDIVCYNMIVFEHKKNSKLNTDTGRRALQRGIWAMQDLYLTHV